MMRLSMLLFSTTTFAAVSATATPHFDLNDYVVAQLYVLGAHVIVHLLGEHYDATSDGIQDALRRRKRALESEERALVNDDDAPTGGSGAPMHLKASRVPLQMAAAIAVLALPPLATMLKDARARRVALALLLAATQYSAPPLRLNHNGLGEVGGAIVQNVLLAAFARASQCPHASLLPHAVDVVACVLKTATFWRLNAADIEADAMAGKHTLATLTGTHVSALCVRTLLLAACALALTTLPRVVGYGLAALVLPLAVRGDGLPSARAMLFVGPWLYTLHLVAARCYHPLPWAWCAISLRVAATR